MMIALMPLPLGADPCLLHDYRCNCLIPSTNVDVDLLMSNNDVVSCGNQS
jgi:hypothetical protein